MRTHRPSLLSLTAMALLLAASPTAAAGERRGDDKSTSERPRVVPSVPSRMRRRP